MSAYLMGQVWRHCIDRSSRDVLLALADWGDDNGGRIFPSMDLLAWKLDISKRQAQRIVSKLRDCGALVVVQEATRYTPTHYRMVLAVFDRKMPLNEGDAWNAGVTDPSSLRSRGDISRTAGVTSSATRDDTAMSPEPLEITVIEPSEVSAPAREPLPEGFPDELLPHLRSVFRVLREVAVRHQAKAVKPMSLANVVMARHRKPLVKAAYDYAAWTESKSRQHKDVVAAYRRWLDNEDDLAAIEHLGEDGLPAGRTVASNGNGRTGRRLKDRTYRGLSWDELTATVQENVRESVTMGLEVWDGGRDAWEDRERREAEEHAAFLARRDPNAEMLSAENFGNV